MKKEKQRTSEENENKVKQESSFTQSPALWFEDCSSPLSVSDHRKPRGCRVSL